MTKHTDYINLTNDELLTLVYTKEDPSQLEIELAQRLENALIEVDGLTSEGPSLDEIIASVAP